MSRSLKKMNGHIVCSDIITPRIMQTYSGGAPAENMSEILNELQEF